MAESVSAYPAQGQPKHLSASPRPGFKVAPQESILDKDRRESTKRAFESGAYEKDDQGNMQFKGVK